MTVKRHHTKEGDPTTNLEIVKWGMSTNVFRMVLLIFVFSMHPLGRQVLGTFGFKFPDEQKLIVATDEAKGLRSDVEVLKSDVKDLRDTARSVRDNNTIINNKLDELSRTFVGFQIDFNKWKPKDPNQ